MVKSYQIIDDTVYSVNDDGFITKHITIMEDGSLINGNGKKLSTESRPVWDGWEFIVAFSVVVLSFAIIYIYVLL